MKKIPFLLLMVVMAVMFGILAGCANQPAENVNSELHPNPYAYGNNSPSDIGVPPRTVTLRSAQEFRALYSALEYEDKALEEFLKTNGGYSVNGLRNRKDLETFWKITLALKIPSIENIPNLDRFGLEYKPEAYSYRFWYVAGGRQYHFYYYPGKEEPTEIVENPVATGKLHGAEIRLTEEPAGTSFEYSARFYLDGYDVRLYIRNDLEVTDPMPIDLNYSDTAWYEADQKGNITFHLPKTEATE